MTISTLDQRLLDLMDRIEQEQQEKISALERRLDVAEGLNAALAQRVNELEQTNARESKALSSLNATLARFLDPSESPRSSDTSSTD